MPSTDALVRPAALVPVSPETAYASAIVKLWHLRRRDAETMIRERPDRGWFRLYSVETRHVVAAIDHLAGAGKGTRVLERSGTTCHKVRPDGDHALGAIEVVADMLG